MPTIELSDVVYKRFMEFKEKEEAASDTAALHGLLTLYDNVVLSGEYEEFMDY